MSDTANVLHEVIVVFLFPTVTMTVKVRNLIHNQMNMDFICIRVNRVHDLILRRIVLNNSLRVVIGLLRGDMFLSIKADNRMTYVLATVFAKGDGSLLHLCCRCLGGADIAATDICGFLRIEDVIDAVVV